MTAPAPSALQPGETYEALADRLLEEHGPPPQSVVDLVHGMQLAAAEQQPAPADTATVGA